MAMQRNSIKRPKKHSDTEAEMHWNDDVNDKVGTIANIFLKGERKHAI